MLKEYNEILSYFDDFYKNTIMKEQFSNINKQILEGTN
jgi:hypothetical protein